MKKLLPILMVFLFHSCFISRQEENNNEQYSPNITPLSGIPDNASYSNLPLEGITWKFVGFGNVETQTLRFPEIIPTGIDCTIKLENGQLKGRSYSNQLSGNYYRNDEENEFRIHGIGGTRVGEPCKDAHLYWSCLDIINSYEITPKGLFLYYESNLFLLFEVLE